MLSALSERNVVVERIVSPVQVVRIARSYDAAVTSASPEDIVIGGDTTRVVDFVNRGPISI